MAKKIQTTIKLQLPAGKATPAPPVGTALGPHGLNIMDFCKQFNAKTAKEPDGMIFPVLVTVYTDRTFTFILKTPPASVLLKRAANIAKGSAEPNRNKVGKDVVQKIMEGWTDFDAVIATPDMMRSAGKLGKVLGPRGLMPNPKTGTVTFEVAKAIKEVKAGKVEFRVDKAGIVHCPIGKIQFDGAKLAEDAHVVIEAVVKAKPAAAKGKYVKKITLTSTMGPGITIDLAEVEAMAAAA